jgi:hypothetical protein
VIAASWSASQARCAAAMADVNEKTREKLAGFSLI